MAYQQRNIERALLNLQENYRGRGYSGKGGELHRKISQTRFRTKSKSSSPKTNKLWPQSLHYHKKNSYSRTRRRRRRSGSLRKKK